MLDEPTASNWPPIVHRPLLSAGMHDSLFRTTFYFYVVENGKVVPDEDTIDAACKRKDNIRIMRILRKAG